MTAQQLYNIGKEYEKEIDKPMWYGIHRI